MLKVYCFYLISLLLFFFIVWFLLNWIQSNKPTFTLRALVLNSDFFCSHCCHMAARCASVPKLIFFPAELGYFFTVAAGCFSILWVEATPLMQYLHPTPTPPQNTNGQVLDLFWEAIGQILLWKPGNPVHIVLLHMWVSSEPWSVYTGNLILATFKQQCEQQYKKKNPDLSKNRNEALGSQCEHSRSGTNHQCCPGETVEKSVLGFFFQVIRIILITDALKGMDVGVFLVK